MQIDAEVCCTLCENEKKSAHLAKPRQRLLCVNVSGYASLSTRLAPPGVVLHDAGAGEDGGAVKLTLRARGVSHDKARAAHR